MTVQFTPQFFSQQTSGAPVASSSGISSGIHGASPSSGQNYSSGDNHTLAHINPNNPQALRLANKKQQERYISLNNDSSSGIVNEHYANIDWRNKEVITQDGRRVKFGAPRFNN